ncbi:hypothetical protein DUNSADRAFT_8190 [Dunaliella salina]|uniref:Uncharacterized protein n=1 Tax=Dunaliella salina TaxID=3046 RepID=A0ABQ7GJV1_DUNSA|nr:hypothetical protein DUNSADRAFT_8190 [Dunaliella salina]|eukprot:KAF5834886.1 hypothetical protein DUNSADRAFT_8190 [Dunaliella salina]
MAGYKMLRSGLLQELIMNATPNPPQVGDVGLLSYTHTQLWAAQKLVVNILWFCSNEAFVRPYLPVFSVLSLYNIVAARLRQTRPLKAGVIVGSLYRIYVNLLLSFRKELPGMLVYADLPTFLLVFLPELLILDWGLGLPLYAFAFSHAGVCALLYAMTGMHGILVSICRAFGFHGICFFVFLAIRHKAHSYCVRASKAPASVPPKANKQLQMDTDDEQQHKLHQRLQHEQQQQEHRPMWIPAKEQQPEGGMQGEPGKGPLVGQTSDAAAAAAVAAAAATAAHMAPQSMSNQGVPSETQATLGSAPAVGGSTAAVGGVPAAGVKHSPGGMSQPQLPCMGLNSKIQSALARQLLPEKQSGSAPWTKGDHSSGNSLSKSSITYSSSIDSAHNSSRIMKVHPGVPHLRLHAAAPASPVVARAVADMLRAKADVSKRPPYVSKITQPRSPQTTAHYLRAACRLAVKINGPAPDAVPRGSLANFQAALERYQGWMHVDSPSVRAGCLVISFGAVPCGQGCTLQQLKDGALAVASEWARQHGLLPPGEDGLLTVQACPSPHGDSALDGQSSEYSIAMHSPFLIPKLEKCDPASSTQKQSLQQQQVDQNGHSGNGQAPEHALGKEAFCEFELTIHAPPEFQLRGWQGAEDAPESKSRSLCLLATLNGQFLGVTVKEESQCKVGERVVQVCIGLPADTSTSCLQAMMLELWAAGTLVCSCSAVLVTPCLAGAAAAAQSELQGWAAADPTSALLEGCGPFMQDLVTWLHFQACCQEQQQQQQEIGERAARDAVLSDTMQQQLGLMKDVGMDLLDFSLSQSMPAVAGWILECFAAFPFCINPTALQDALLTAHPGDQPVPDALSKESHEDQQGVPLTGTSQSSSHFNGNLHSYPTHAVPVPSTVCAAAPQNTLSSVLTRLNSAPLAVSCKLAPVVKGLFPAQLFREEDADYRAWSNAHVACLARHWCWVWVISPFLGALRMALMRRVPPLREVCSWTPVLLGYTAGAFMIKPGSRHSEVILVVITLLRICFSFMLGIGILPLSETNKLLLLGWRAEVLSEVIMMSVMERVRLSWTVPLRALLTGDNGGIAVLR